MEMKRLFLAMEVIAPWPEEFPEGRVFLETDRHITLVFLGNCDLPLTIQILQEFPDPGFQIGLAGIFDRPVFLPDFHPNTVGWHVRLLEKSDRFFYFRQKNRASLLCKNPYYIFSSLVYCKRTLLLFQFRAMIAAADFSNSN